MEHRFNASQLHHNDQHYRKKELLHNALRNTRNFSLHQKPFLEAWMGKNLQEVQQVYTMPFLRYVTH